MRVASTKPDLNISKVVFRLDIADTLLLKLHVCGNKKGLTRGINYRVHVDLCIRYVKNLNCSIASSGFRNWNLRYDIWHETTDGN